MPAISTEAVIGAVQALRDARVFLARGPEPMNREQFALATKLACAEGALIGAITIAVPDFELKSAA